MSGVLDVRGLAPPEPLERILDALAVLPLGEALNVLLPREPFPLYDLLRSMGYRWQTTGQDGEFSILIWDPRPVPEGVRPGETLPT